MRSLSCPVLKLSGVKRQPAEMLDGARLLAHVQQLGIREGVEAATTHVASDFDHSLGKSHSGRRLHQQRVHDTHDDCGGAYSNGHGDGRNRGEQRPLPEHTQRVAQISEYRVHGLSWWSVANLRATSIGGFGTDTVHDVRLVENPDQDALRAAAGAASRSSMKRRSAALQGKARARVYQRAASAASPASNHRPAVTAGSR